MASMRRNPNNRDAAAAAGLPAIAGLFLPLIVGKAHMKYTILQVGMLLAVFSAAPAIAQDQHISVWDGIYTDEQADRGAGVYAAHCAMCHGPTPFIEQFDNQPLSELFNFIRTMMPEGSPGSLSGAQYSDSLAYILREKGFPTGESELPTVSRSMTDILLTISNDDEEEAEEPDASINEELYATEH